MAGAAAKAARVAAPTRAVRGGDSGGRGGDGGRGGGRGSGGGRGGRWCGGRGHGGGGRGGWGHGGRRGGTQLLLPPASWATVVRCQAALHAAAMRRLLLLGWPPAITAAVPSYLGAARGWLCSVPAAAAAMGLVVVTGPFFGWL